MKVSVNSFALFIFLLRLCLLIGSKRGGRRGRERGKVLLFTSFLEPPLSPFAGEKDLSKKKKKESQSGLSL